MKVYFERDGYRSEIGVIDRFNDAWGLMNSFCEQRELDLSGMRFKNIAGEMWVDFGNGSEFLIVGA